MALARREEWTWGRIARLLGPEAASVHERFRRSPACRSARSPEIRAVATDHFAGSNWPQHRPPDDDEEVVGSAEVTMRSRSVAAERPLSRPIDGGERSTVFRSTHRQADLTLLSGQPDAWRNGTHAPAAIVGPAKRIRSPAALRFLRQAEDALADDVALDLAGTAPDGLRPAEEERAIIGLTG